MGINSRLCSGVLEHMDGKYISWHIQLSSFSSTDEAAKTMAFENIVFFSAPLGVIDQTMTMMVTPSRRFLTNETTEIKVQTLPSLNLFIVTARSQYRLSYLSLNASKSETRSWIEKVFFIIFFYIILSFLLKAENLKFLQAWQEF